jgi:dihydrofolate synthase/folylpolyglutamate synthase
VLGAGLTAPAAAVARRVAQERGARIVQAPAQDDIAAALPSGSYQRQNFALARTAAEAYLQAVGIAPQADALRAGLAAAEVPGRLQLIERDDPPTLLDGAHNPDAVAALVRALPHALPRRPRALVLGVLEDKDAAAMLAQLVQHCDRAWFTAPPGDRALPPAALLEHARRLGFAAAESEPRPSAALAQASTWAREHGGSVLATGSIYLAGALLEDREPDAGRRSGTLP